MWQGWSSAAADDSDGGLTPRGITLRLAVLGAAAYVTHQVFERLADDPLATALEAALIAVGLAAGWLAVGRPLERSAAIERFAARLHRGLELADSRDQVLAVVGRALNQVSEQRSSRLFLADPGSAHLAEVVSAGSDRWPACAVQQPSACPAVRQARTLVFSSGAELDACPLLSGSAERPCSAVCIPVNVLDRSEGVLHVTGRPRRPPPPREVARLRGVALAMSARLGVLRALAQSQLRASTDSLTGLLNRRSLDEKGRELRELSVPFAAALIDLDRFKAVNDAFGHETGDRALRLFAQTLREVVRDHDVGARYGGDEFVILFPRCPLEAAAEALERLQAVLAEAVGRAEVPAFTCSAGLADTTFSPTLDGVLRTADQALLQAKASGRNCVVTAGSPAVTAVAGSPAVAAVADPARLRPVPSPDDLVVA